MVFCSIMLQETSAQESFSFQLQLCFLEKVRRFLANIDNSRVSSGCELQGNTYFKSCIDSEKTSATDHSRATSHKATKSAIGSSRNNSTLNPFDQNKVASERLFHNRQRTGKVTKSRNSHGWIQQQRSYEKEGGQIHLFR